MEWLKGVEEKEASIHPQEKVTTTKEKLLKKLKSAKNWKSPGPAIIHGYWWKKLSHLHSRLALQLQHTLDHGPPEWLTEGRTVLIQKSKAKGLIPSNYRPITCLCTVWMTGIVADEVYTHLESKNVIPVEEKGCRKNTRGTKDQLLIDKLLLLDSRAKHKNLELVWIEYKKACDSVPHSWIWKCLQMFKLAKLWSFSYIRS